jgi:hypothetical protein
MAQAADAVARGAARPHPVSAALDHLVVSAKSLEDGARWLEERLGTLLPFGGRHPLMGTHNRLAQLGNGAFLETIAVDPEAPAPGRRRWFALEDPAEQARLARRPRLATWVAGVDELPLLDSELQEEIGPAIPVTRGDLSWELTVRPDGALAQGGTLPSLIRWSRPPHPSMAMADPGLRLEGLRLFHPEPERLRAWLDRLGAGALAAIRPGTAPRLEADIRRPDGRVVTLD